MSIKQKFLAYHKSIGEELTNSEKRVRNLIGRSHWLTDGEHKESIVRKILNDFLPEIYRVGTGFICYPESNTNRTKNSSQIDVLITSKTTPTLYKNGGLHFITPECARAIIEVKTNLKKGENIKSILLKLSLEIKNIRENTSNTELKCWAGLFVYNIDKIKIEDVLKVLQEITSNDINSTINCVSIGKNVFIKFWETGHPEGSIGIDPVWHAYEINNMAQAYFISNLVEYLSPGFNEHAIAAWFPIPDTKERHRIHYAKLSENSVYHF